MRLPSRYAGQPKALRFVTGLVYLAVTVMLLVALRRFVTLILPKYGGRFSYMIVLFGGVACWMAFRGLQLLLGRQGDSGRQS